MADTVKVPTTKGISGSFKNLGIGALGGVLMVLGMRIFGGLGAIAAPLVVGAMIKDDNAKVITTLAGFSLGAALLGGGGGVAGSSDAGEM